MVGYYRLNELGFRLESGAHILPRELFEPIEAATLLIEQARENGARIVETARQELESERARGYAEGCAKARLETLQRLLGEADLLENRIASIEGDLVEIVIASVRSLIDDFDDQAKAENLVRTALRKMRREKRAELRVSRAQHSRMKAFVSSLMEEFPEIELIDVVEDASLVAPQIIVETSIGRVDGDLGRSLKALEHVLRSALRNKMNPKDENSIQEAQP